MTTPLQKKRLAYAPPIPTLLKALDRIRFSDEVGRDGVGSSAEIKKYFPHTYGLPIMRPRLEDKKRWGPLNVGIVLSGGQAPGGHNVITGLFDALKTVNSDSRLIGFLNGPSGIIEGKWELLSKQRVDNYRNQGGFDLIGSGRTKIETKEQFAKACATFTSLGLDGVVIVGGDDSNTNAALLAEYLADQKCPTRIIGLPKTIDGDLQNEYVPIPFGFDSACRVYSEMIGNIARDALSAKKYTHFIKLMGRFASHITLECALNTQPNCALIAEEIAAEGKSLQDIAEELSEMVEKRDKQGKHYGVILIPEGLIEFIPEMKMLIQELNLLLGREEDAVKKLSDKSKKIFDYLPSEVQSQLLLDRDPHGNVQVSQIQTEKLLSSSVQKRLDQISFTGAFRPIHHFFGYEGRSAFPSNFDATYCYSLGLLSAALIAQGLTGYMGCITQLDKKVEDWGVCALPLTSLMHMDVRKGKRKPVVQKTLVDLNKGPFQTFQRMRPTWEIEDHYRFPGPMQFGGDCCYMDEIPSLVRIRSSD